MKQSSRLGSCRPWSGSCILFPVSVDRINEWQPSFFFSADRTEPGIRSEEATARPGKNSPERLWHGLIHRFARILLLCCVVGHLACAVSKQLSQNKAREKIQELGLIQFQNKDIQVKKIVQSGDNQAVVEANLSMAFRLSRPKDGEWQVNAIRLGDRNWIDAEAFISALNEVRLRETRENLTKLMNGLKLFKERNGKYPKVHNIVELTDMLVPKFLTEMIRYDGWNRELVVNVMPSDSLELVSLGADGIRGTADDIAVTP